MSADNREAWYIIMLATKRPGIAADNRGLGYLLTTERPGISADNREAWDIC